MSSVAMDCELSHEAFPAEPPASLLRWSTTVYQHYQRSECSTLKQLLREKAASAEVSRKRPVSDTSEIQAYAACEVSEHMQGNP